MKEFLIGLFALLFAIPICFLLSHFLNINLMNFRRLDRLQEAIDSQIARESTDRFTHLHTENWEYIEKLLPWQFRLQLSRRRGKTWALKWRIKVYSLFHGIGPKVAQWILEEYMITKKLEDLPPPANTWVCPHCGTANTDTALFCKDCGEYK